MAASDGWCTLGRSHQRTWTVFGGNGFGAGNLGQWCDRGAYIGIGGVSFQQSCEDGIIIYIWSLYPEAELAEDPCMLDSVGNTHHPATKMAVVY